MGHDATQASSIPATPTSGAPSSSSSALPSAEDVWAAAQKRVRGYTSLSVTGTDSTDGDTSVWVTTGDEHDVLEAAGPDEFGMATFSRWNETIPVPRPAGAIAGGGAGPSRPTSSGAATT